MARAYAYCMKRGPFPPEMEIKQAISEYGVRAVTGRDTLSANEIRKIQTIENVIRAYRARESYRDEEGHKDYPGWAKEHPEQNRVLERAMLAEAEGEGGDA